jgi:glutamyl-tRNA reductase
LPSGITIEQQKTHGENDNLSHEEGRAPIKEQLSHHSLVVQLARQDTPQNPMKSDMKVVLGAGSMIQRVLGAFQEAL